MWAERTSETFEAIKEAAALADRFEIGWWYAKTAPTPRGVSHTLGADVQIL
jgi:hypothetical protein